MMKSSKTPSVPVVNQSLLRGSGKQSVCFEVTDDLVNNIISMRTPKLDVAVATLIHELFGFVDPPHPGDSSTTFKPAGVLHDYIRSPQFLVDLVDNMHNLGYNLLSHSLASRKLANGGKRQVSVFIFRRESK